MAKVNVFNQTDTSVQVDGRGRTLGGRERAEVEDTYRVKRLVELGVLVYQESQEEKVEADADATTKKKEK